MKKEKLINEIDLAIESIRMHVKRLKSDGQAVHKMDTDLLIEKTRELYGHLIQLDEFTIPFGVGRTEGPKMEVEEKTTDQIMKEEVIPEKTVEVSNEEDKVPDAIIEPEEQEKETWVREDEQKAAIEEAQEQLEPEGQEEETKINMFKSETPVEKPEESVTPVAEDRSEKEEETAKREVRPKSTIDLFSTSAEPTLGDRLKSVEQPTIADKITKNTINELREAIGINEKFLFINELFNGDLSRYNKIIDELDQLQTMEGVNTYMLELKIQSQWQDDSDAFAKLTELLQRKFVK